MPTVHCALPCGQASLAAHGYGYSAGIATVRLSPAGDRLHGRSHGGRRRLHALLSGQAGWLIAFPAERTGQAAGGREPHAR